MPTGVAPRRPRAPPGESADSYYLYEAASDGTDPDEAAARERAKRVLGDFIKVKARSAQLERQLANLYQENEGLVKLLQDKRFELAAAKEAHQSEVEQLRSRLALAEARLDKDSWESWSYAVARQAGAQKPPASVAPPRAAISVEDDAQRRIDVLARRVVELTKSKAEAEAGAREARAELERLRRGNMERQGAEDAAADAFAERLRDSDRRAAVAEARAQALERLLFEGSSRHDSSSRDRAAPLSARTSAPPPGHHKRLSTPAQQSPSNSTPQYSDGANASQLRRALLVSLSYPESPELLLQQSAACAGRVQGLLSAAAGPADPSAVAWLGDCPEAGALPTRAAVLQGLRWLAAGVSGGGAAFCYFIGHGGTGEDGAEAVVPSDFETDGGVSAADVSDCLSDLPDNASVLILCDCRYSGTMLELPFQLVADPGGGAPRWRPSVSTPQTALPADITVISVASPDPEAPPSGAVAEGALTDAFADCLRAPPPDASCGALLQALAAGMAARGCGSMVPQIARSRPFRPADPAASSAALGALVGGGLRSTVPLGQPCRGPRSQPPAAAEAAAGVATMPMRRSQQSRPAPLMMRGASTTDAFGSPPPSPAADPAAAAWRPAARERSRAQGAPAQAGGADCDRSNSLLHVPHAESYLAPPAPPSTPGAPSAARSFSGTRPPPSTRAAAAEVALPVSGAASCGAPREPPSQRGAAAEVPLPLSVATTQQPAVHLRQSSPPAREMSGVTAYSTQPAPPGEGSHAQARGDARRTQSALHGPRQHHL
eukprot:TRINITY_DN19647_c0_g1_i1.p1 TRINITY_DN19647_c0_g1~~TRINITY_DN19647_c0_g1_i1.p1  ORF type:complete len:800 (+),score=205.12 TRINITY_DN19647_c0_g1_i1:72-2402(+)